MSSQNVFRSQYKELSEDEKVLIDNIKNKAEELLELIQTSFPAEPSPRGRYIALASTSLEESIMWAVKGITALS